VLLDGRIVNNINLYSFPDDKIQSRFDDLSEKYEDLKNRYRQKSIQVIKLKKELQHQKNKHQKLVNKQVVKKQLDSSLFEVIQVPRYEHSRKALHQIFQELLEWGVELRCDARYPFVWLSLNGEVLGKIVAHKKHFNILLNGKQFIGLEDIYDWYEAASPFILFDLETQ
jgi:hypothetical protein